MIFVIPPGSSGDITRNVDQKFHEPKKTGVSRPVGSVTRTNLNKSPDLMCLTKQGWIELELKRLTKVAKV